MYSLRAQVFLEIYNFIEIIKIKQLGLIKNIMRTNKCIYFIPNQFSNLNIIFIDIYYFKMTLL